MTREVYEIEYYNDYYDHCLTVAVVTSAKFAQRVRDANLHGVNVRTLRVNEEHKIEALKLMMRGFSLYDIELRPSGGCEYADELDKKLFEVELEEFPWWRDDEDRKVTHYHVIAQSMGDAVHLAGQLHAARKAKGELP